MKFSELDKFTQAYIECALWTSYDESTEQGGEPFDANYSVEDIADEALASMAEDCKDFQEANTELLAQAYNLYSYHPPRNAYTGAELAGHDFWLTRNRHGAGFWDRVLGEVGTKLTDAAHAYGSCDLYLGDDGQIHAS